VLNETEEPLRVLGPSQAVPYQTNDKVVMRPAKLSLSKLVQRTMHRVMIILCHVQMHLKKNGVGSQVTATRIAVV
jgi:hypothetical protein